MHKKIFIKNRPFDIIDATELQDWTEEALKVTMQTIYSYGVAIGLLLSPASGMSLNLESGYAFDSNFDYINVTSRQTITLAASNPTNPRRDLIAIKYKKTVKDNIDTTNKYGLGSSFIYSQNNLDSFDIVVVTGTPSATPALPATPAGALPIGNILIPANSSSISAGNIADLRPLLSINQNINTPDVVIGPNAPSNTNVLWMDSNAKKIKFHDGNAWTVTDAKNADTVGGKGAADFAPSTHNHDSSYYTKGQSDSNYAPINHNHDGSYYTKTQLNTNAGGGLVHWGNISNKPATYPPDAHNHDNSYYTKAQSDASYLTRSDNLNSLTDKAAARSNLGLGTMATQSTAGYAIASHNHDTVYVKGDYTITIGITPPPSPTTKDIWIDTNTNIYRWKLYNGSSWVLLNSNDASTVGGTSVGTGPNNILKLDNSGLVPANNLPAADTGTKGAVILSTSTNDTSTTKAATPSSVKAAYDLGNNALPKSGGQVSGVIDCSTNAAARLIIPVGTNRYVP